MPDLKTVTLAVPLSQILDYFQSEDFNAKLNESVGGKAVVRVAMEEGNEFNVVVELLGFGTGVAVRVSAHTDRSVRSRPPSLFGCHADKPWEGASEYFCRNMESAGTAARVESIVTGKFGR